MAIDLWLFALDRPADEIAALATTLDAAERDRAGRFRFAVDRDRFVSRRGQLRRLLGGYLGRPAAAIGYGETGNSKPVIGDGDGLRFSLSHSDDMALCAVARGIELGCDIERHRPDLADPEVARRLFAPAEYQAIEALPESQRSAAFFNCWTRKEAFVKAIGLGLSYPLDAFEVSVAPGEPAALLRGGDGWSLRALDLGAVWHGALVVPDEPASIAGAPRPFAPFRT
jgi:4'-phosphopantetheinyl transferase